MEFKNYSYIVNNYKKIRIFLSSTFEDMFFERNQVIEAVKSITPWCDTHGIDIDVIDLRWGISTEASTEGRTIPLCLRLIDDCVPFFISIVGSRKGWIPTSEDVCKTVLAMVNKEEIEDNFSNGIKNAIHVLRDGLGHYSITEMEIRHALLCCEKEDPLFIIKKGIDETDCETKSLIDIAKSHNHVFYESSDANGELQKQLTINGSAFVDYIAEYLKNKCFKLMQIEDGEYERDDLEIQFIRECTCFNKLQEIVCSDYGISDSMAKFFQDGKRFFAIGGIGSDLSMFITALLDYCFRTFYAYICFSYGTLTNEMLMHQLAKIYEDNELVDEDEDFPVIIIAQNIDADVYKYILKNDDVIAFVGIWGFYNYVIKSADDKGNGADTNIWSICEIPKLRKSEIRFYIEKRLSLNGRILASEQVERLSHLEAFTSMNNLDRFIERLNNTILYTDVYKLIDSACGEEFYENLHFANTKEYELIVKKTFKKIINDNNHNVEGILEKIKIGELIDQDTLNNVKRLIYQNSAIKSYEVVKDRKDNMYEHMWIDTIIRLNYCNCCIGHLVQYISSNLNKESPKEISDYLEDKISDITQIISGAYMLYAEEISEGFTNTLYKHDEKMNAFSSFEDFVSLPFKDRMAKVRGLLLSEDSVGYNVAARWEYTADVTTYTDGSTEYNNLVARPTCVMRRRVNIPLYGAQVIEFFFINESSMETKEKRLLLRPYNVNGGYKYEEIL